MTTMTMRSYAGERDLEPLVAFINACEEHDRLDSGTSLADLRVELNFPELDQQRDLRLWEDESGALVAFGRLWAQPLETGVIDVFYSFWVRPDCREKELDQLVLGFGEERAREIGREKGSEVLYRAGVRSDDPWRRPLLERSGYHPVRYFLRMLRPLDQPIPEMILPEGFTVRSMTRAELPAWVEMYNQSFIDHWNFHPLTLEQAQYWLDNDPEYHPDGDLVIVAPDGTLAAFTLNIIHREDNRRTGRNEALIHLVGTRRGYRKLGLGRAVLIAALRWAKAQGMDAAKLGVDADNPTGATRLYDSVGFQTAATFTSYSKAL